MIDKLLVLSLVCLCASCDPSATRAAKTAATDAATKLGLLKDKDVVAEMATTGAFTIVSFRHADRNNESLNLSVVIDAKTQKVTTIIDRFGNGCITTILANEFPALMCKVVHHDNLEKMELIRSVPQADGQIKSVQYGSQGEVQGQWTGRLGQSH